MLGIFYYKLNFSERNYSQQKSRPAPPHKSRYMLYLFANRGEFQQLVFSPKKSDTRS